MLLILLALLTVGRAGCARATPGHGIASAGPASARSIERIGRPRLALASAHPSPARSTLRWGAIVTSLSGGGSEPVAPRESGMLPAALRADEFVDHSPISLPDTAPEAVLLEIRLGAVATRTVEAYRLGNEALIPLRSFFDMAAIAGTITPAGRAEAALPTLGTLVVDAALDTASLGRRRQPMPAGSVLWRDGELYVSAARLGELLGMPMYVNWPELEVVARDASPLPVAQQARRRSARDALRAARGEVPADRRLVTGPGGWNGFVLDYSLFTPGSDPLGGSSYALQAGMDLAGGSLELGATSVGPADAGDVRIDGSWLGVWRGNRWLRQLRIGDGASTGPRPRTVRGLTVTNAPYLRPSLVGSVAYAGSLAPGWELEAYRGGQLIAYDSAGFDGSFDVEVPVLYGENPVEFIAYGPHGETRRFAQTYRVSSALLPARVFEYGVSAGKCRLAPCSATVNTDLRYGLSSRLTAQVGAERFWRDSQPDLFHPYAAVTASLTNAVTVQGEGVLDGYARAAASWEPTLDRRLTAEHTRYAGGIAAPLITAPDRRSRTEVSAFYRPVHAKDFLYFEASAERITTLTGHLDRARIGASTQVGPVRLLPYLRLEDLAADGAAVPTKGYAGLNGILIPGGGWGRVLRGTYARGSIEIGDHGGATAAGATIARQVASFARLEVGVNWVRGSAGPFYTLTLASHLRSLRSITTATAQRGAASDLTQLVQGSVLYDRSRGVTLSAGPSLQRSGIAGRVFLDENGNGLRDPVEPGLPRVRVQIGSVSAVSDTTGSYHVWDVVPFEPVVVRVDSLSFDSPLWVASRAEVYVVPPPNQFTPVDIPLVVGSVVEGRVVRPFGGEMQGVPGAELVLTNRETGTTRSVTTFTDGTFYTLGIVPGDYEVSLSPRTLDLLAVAAEPRRIVVRGGGGDVPPVELVLAPRP